MSDETTIEPALSAEEWARWQRGEVVKNLLGCAPRRNDTFRSLDLDGHATQVYGVDAALAIALLNDLLPDDDPRKITRRLVYAVRIATENANTPSHYEALHALADALASYLPPEP